MTNEEKYQEAKAILEKALEEFNQVCLDILKDRSPAYIVDENGNGYQ